MSLLLFSIFFNVLFKNQPHNTLLAPWPYDKVYNQAQKCLQKHNKSIDMYRFFNFELQNVFMQGAWTQEFYRNVRAVTPVLQSNQQLRLIHGQTELRENSTTLQSLGIHHGSTVFAVIRTVGGSDPRVTMLLNCPNFSCRAL